LIDVPKGSQAQDLLSIWNTEQQRLRDGQIWGW